MPHRGQSRITCEWQKTGVYCRRQFQCPDCRRSACSPRRSCCIQSWFLSGLLGLPRSALGRSRSPSLLFAPPSCSGSSPTSDLLKSSTNEFLLDISKLIFEPRRGKEKKFEKTKFGLCRFLSGIDNFPSYLPSALGLLLGEPLSPETPHSEKNFTPTPTPSSTLL